MATISAQGSLFRIKQLNQKLPTANDLPSTSRRGDVIGFSRRARKRLMDLVATLDNDMSASFITLTYGQGFPPCDVSKSHLHNFARRLLRLSPNSAVIWRMELQERGAPHYHLLLTNPAWIDKTKLARFWHEVIGDQFADYSSGFAKAPFTQIRYVPPHSKSKVLAYVSKYVAKKPQTIEDAQSLDLAGGGFNNVPYLTTFGRVWGVYGRKNLPYAPQVVITHRPSSPLPERAHRSNRKLEASFSVTKYGLSEIKRLGGDTLGGMRSVASHLFPHDDYVGVSSSASFVSHRKVDNSVYEKTLNDIKRLLRKRHKKNWLNLRDRVMKKGHKFKGSYRPMMTSPTMGASLYVDDPSAWIDAYYYFWDQHLSKIDF